MTKRSPMLVWLKELVTSDTVTGLRWLDAGSGEFRMPWRRNSAHLTEEDTRLFRLYAEHTGKREGRGPVTWKQNFRSALHGLEKKAAGIEEVRGRRTAEHRVYRFVSPVSANRRSRGFSIASSSSTVSGEQAASSAAAAAADTADTPSCSSGGLQTVPDLTAIDTRLPDLPEFHAGTDAKPQTAGDPTATGPAQYIEAGDMNTSIGLADASFEISPPDLSIQMDWGMEYERMENLSALFPLLEDNCGESTVSFNLLA